MIFIAHRGNLRGPSERENEPSYIREAIEAGFEVEVDVWLKPDGFYLGHDSPKYLIDYSFMNDKMWLHCKNVAAAEELSKTNLKWFWHDKDLMTLTSSGDIWCYTGIYVEGGITVECGHPKQIDKNILGICTDYPIEWNEESKNEF